ncbi:hypothetical protein KKE19_03510 [Patescibacteria group bacterium]|nr:hypothetical protein [Patescibacteria group bacterium]MBU4367977.1 hypothetical protein [Patescibacteria group bacterium]MBU4462158.1 hypothetical protein [Patescibacteria group bacterium]MCG2699820.1 hypothetical protein [Candidatus Parcubacteria bacterium]
MLNLGEIDKMVQGWGLQLDCVEIEKLLEHLLWECMNPDEFQQKCEFIFDDIVISLIWEEQKRSVTIWLKGGKEISVSV